MQNTNDCLRRLGLFLLLIGAPAVGQDFGKADQAIEAAVAAGQIPGAVLLVGSNGQTVHEKAFGSRALKPTTQPMQNDTVFDLASLTKPVATATSVMLLIERGKLDLHAPVAMYIPEFAQNGKDEITVEHLLLHWGGLIPDNPMADYADGPAVAWQKIYATKPRTEPGTAFAYTDVGFIVLGKLVEVVDGRPIDQFAREEVFLPLGMNETTYHPTDALKARCITAEQRGGRWMVGEVHDPRAHALGGVAGHAGLFSTAADLARWCEMFTGGKSVLKPETIAQMTALHMLPDGKGGRGYGVDIQSSYAGCRGDRFEKGSTFGHTGYTGTMLWIDPKHRCYVILLTNRVHPNDKGQVGPLRRQVSTEVANALLGP